MAPIIRLTRLRGLIGLSGIIARSSTDTLFVSSCAPSCTSFIVLAIRSNTRLFISACVLTRSYSELSRATSTDRLSAPRICSFR